MGLAFVWSVFTERLLTYSVLSWRCPRLWGVVMDKADKVPVLVEPFIPADYED